MVGVLREGGEIKEWFDTARTKQSQELHLALNSEWRMQCSESRLKVGIVKVVRCGQLLIRGALGVIEKRGEEGRQKQGWRSMMQLDGMGQEDEAAQAKSTQPLPSDLNPLDSSHLLALRGELWLASMRPFLEGWLDRAMGAYLHGCGP
jgi:hypothetical protein